MNLYDDILTGGVTVTNLGPALEEVRDIDDWSVRIAMWSRRVRVRPLDAIRWALVRVEGLPRELRTAASSDDSTRAESDNGQPSEHVARRHRLPAEKELRILAAALAVVIHRRKLCENGSGKVTPLLIAAQVEDAKDTLWGPTKPTESDEMVKRIVSHWLGAVGEPLPKTGSTSGNP